MSFQQALSGLNAASKNLEVIGNNVSNSNTVGFKSSAAQFADIFANSLGGGGGALAGIGTNVAAVSQSFTQGNFTVTNNPLDMAINAQGFFRMSSGGAVTYTRNGQFQLDKNGFIVDSSGSNLTGYNAIGGVVATGQISNLQIPSTNIAPKATTTITATSNLSSASTVPTVTPFNPTNPLTFNNSTPTTVFDSLGQSHTVVSYFVKSATPNQWNVLTYLDGVPADSPKTGAPLVNATASAAASAFGATAADAAAVAAAANTAALVPGATAASISAAITGILPAPASLTAAQLTNIANIVSAGFTAGGVPGATTQSIQTAITTAATAAGLTSAQAATIASAVPVNPTVLTFNSTGAYVSATNLAKSPTLSNGATTPFNFSLAFSSMTQYGTSSSPALAQDGYTSGQLASFGVGSDGTISGRYTNGQTQTLGQVALANFTNAQGLSPLGNNQFAETAKSGPPFVGIAGTSNLGTIQAGSVENSNVDLTAELVNMITAQRAYQANAQTVKTQDQILQTIVSLR